MTTQRWLVCSLVVLSFNVRTALGADGNVVQADGQAQIRNGDMATAKKEALGDALRHCLEKVVGIQIQSEFTAQQQEVVKGNRDEFYSAVRDNLTQKVEGFVESYEVLGEKNQDGTLTLTVRAKVYESKVRAKTQELADLIAKAGNPKLMLVVQEVYIDEKGTKRVAADSTVGAFLAKELLARGFELRGAESAKSSAQSSIAAYDQWSGDPQAATAAARKEGADILITGRVEITNKGVIEDTHGIDVLKGQTKIEINSIVRGINANNGEIFSTKPVLMSSVGTTLERAVHRALQGRGQNAITQTFDQLLNDLRQSFRKAADQGQAYVVRLSGVTSFRKQGQSFLGAVKGIGGVSSVRQQSFANGVLVLDVDFKGSLADLQRGIFAAVESTKGLANIDLDGISGKQLSLRL